MFHSMSQYQFFHVESKRRIIIDRTQDRPLTKSTVWLNDTEMQYLGRFADYVLKVIMFYSIVEEEKNWSLYCMIDLECRSVIEGGKIINDIHEG